MEMHLQPPRVQSSLGLILLLSFIRTASASQPLAIDWSSTTYGPDGPWNAITIGVGGRKNDTPIKNQQDSVDLYPGGVSYSTWVPDSMECKSGVSDSQCEEGRVWQPDFYANGGIQIEYSPYVRINDTDVVIDGTVCAQAVTVGGQTVYNASLVSFMNGEFTYPNGAEGSLEVGFFGLDSGINPANVAAQTQEFAISNTNLSSGGYNAWVPAGYLYNQSIIPSYSYGLHYGSAALNYPGSLYLGGYDKGRIIGPYSTYGSQNPTLLDMTIGVETGASPFSFTNKSGLLGNDNSNGISVAIEPTVASLYMPPETCETLSDLLPIYFDQATKYYLWNTSDPSYEKVVTSPSYLGFVFPPAPGDSDNVLIKIPFKLLNLTLSWPIVSKPIQYFPCQSANLEQGQYYSLGRAFLQGAFIGYNSMQKIGWLAQAPGPGVSGTGLGTQGTAIADDDSEISVYDGRKTNYFEQSWSAHWTPLSSTSTSAASATASATSASQGSSSQVSSEHDSSTQNTGENTWSPGVVAGISVGGAAAAAAVVTCACLIWLRMRRPKRPTEFPNDSNEFLAKSTTSTDDIHMDPASFRPTEVSSQQEIRELSGKRDTQELHAVHVQELPSRYVVQELSGEHETWALPVRRTIQELPTDTK